MFKDLPRTKRCIIFIFLLDINWTIFHKRRVCFPTDVYAPVAQCTKRGSEVCAKLSGTSALSLRPISSV